VPHPGFTRPELCSIRAATEQAELAEAVPGMHKADGRPPAGDDPPGPLASGIDRAIRLSTAAAVLAVAGIAAYVSYWHAYAVVRAHGETGITAWLEPATIDGLVYASSMVMLSAARHRMPVPSLARWLLALGIAATLTANMAQGWSHGPVGAVVAAWPAVSLVGSYELLVWLIRTSRAADRGPSAEHFCTGAACRTARRPVPASAVDGERPGENQRGTSDPAWRPAGQAAGRSPIPAGGQRDEEVLEASAGNDAAVAAYRLSVQAGNPPSERQLAQMFGRTSRRWARARIADARQASALPDSPSTPSGQLREAQVDNRAPIRRSGGNSQSADISSKPRPNGRSVAPHVPILTAGSRVQSRQRANSGVERAGRKAMARVSDNGPLSLLWTARLLGTSYSASQMTYDLRRLRLNGLIRRIEHTHTYVLTLDGQRLAIFYTKVYNRLLRPLGAADQLQAPPGLRRALAVIDRHVDDYIAKARLKPAA
jgi:Protein of unknown function (DUF2637)